MRRPPESGTFEIPVYWETVEPKSGEFHFEAVDQIIPDARAQNPRLMLLWFASWKNGVIDCAPGWVKENTAKYRRMIDSGGKPVRVLSPHSEAAMSADHAASPLRGSKLKTGRAFCHTTKSSNLVAGILILTSGCLRSNQNSLNKCLAGRLPSAVIALQVL